MIHQLKTWPEQFRALKSGHKTFELRKNDRPFAAGDIVRLREWEPAAAEYTGAVLDRYVSHIMVNSAFGGLAEGYCILSLREVDDPCPKCDLTLSDDEHSSGGSLNGIRITACPSIPLGRIEFYDHKTNRLTGFYE